MFNLHKHTLILYIVSGHVELWSRRDFDKYFKIDSNDRVTIVHRICLNVYRYISARKS